MPNESTVNEQIAREVMGWIPIPHSAERWSGPDPDNRYLIDHPLLDFEHSLDACALAEAEIDKRGLMGRYIVLLENGANEAGTVWPLRLAFLIRLTPAQRCAAMLRAVEVQHA